jgi:hypothetical protein
MNWNDFDKIIRNILIENGYTAQDKIDYIFAFLNYADTYRAIKGEKGLKIKNNYDRD